MVSPEFHSYCYHFDATGNTVAMTDEARDIVNSYAYTLFGIIIAATETIPQPFKYVGQFGVMAEPNGFYYMRARYYDPQVGRFISEDPLGFGGGDVNLYVYCKNNPILFVDPLGLCAQNLSLGERIGQQVQWQVQVSGLTNLPGIAKETVQVLGAAGVGLATYAAYPAVMVAAGTPAGQEILSHAVDFIGAVVPSEAPKPNLPALIGIGISKVPSADNFFHGR